MFTKALATLALLSGASDAFFFRGQYSTNVYDSCLFEVERLCTEHDAFSNTLIRMVETEPEIRSTLDKNPVLQSILNENQHDLTEDSIETMMISSIRFSDVVKNSVNYYDEESPEEIFDLMIIYVMDNSSEKGTIATKMTEYGKKVLESSDEEEGVDDLRRRLASQLVEVKQFPEIRLRKVIPQKSGEVIKSGFPSLKFGAARDVCLWKKFNDGQVADSDCILALNSIGEEVNSRIKRDSPDSVLMLPVRSKSTDESVETTYLIFDRETFSAFTAVTMFLTLFAAIGTIYYIFFDSSEEEEEDDETASHFLFATLLLLPCSVLMWYEPLLSHFAFIPALIVVGIHCCMDVTSRDDSVEEEIETEQMLEKGFAYVALPVQVV